MGFSLAKLRMPKPKFFYQLHYIQCTYPCLEIQNFNASVLISQYDLTNVRSSERCFIRHLDSYNLVVWQCRSHLQIRVRITIVANLHVATLPLILQSKRFDSVVNAYLMERLTVMWSLPVSYCKAVMLSRTRLLETFVRNTYLTLSDGCWAYSILSYLSQK